MPENVLDQTHRTVSFSEPTPLHHNTKPLRRHHAYVNINQKTNSYDVFAVFHPKFEHLFGILLNFSSGKVYSTFWGNKISLNSWVDWCRIRFLFFCRHYMHQYFGMKLSVLQYLQVLQHNLRFKLS